MNIYFEVENYNREMESRILLAMDAASNGHQVYISDRTQILENAKKEVSKIHFESKNNLDKDIQSKKEKIEKEIEKEILEAQKKITELKKNSISSIQIISENIASNIIENLSGDKLNESSVKASVEEITKKNIGKYL